MASRKPAVRTPSKPQRSKPSAGRAGKKPSGKKLPVSRKGGKKPAGKVREQKTRKAAALAPGSLAPARQPLPPAEKDPSFATAMAAAQAALAKKAEGVLILDVRGLTTYADFFVIASGASDRQVEAIADSIDDELKRRGVRPLGVEGYGQGHWVLLDFGDIVCHVFYEEARGFYDIEGLWADARRIPVVDSAPGA